MVSPMPLRTILAGAFTSRLRPPSMPHLFTYQEALRLDVTRRPIGAGISILPVLLWRLLTGQRAMGTALVVGLLHGCIQKGCHIATSTEALAPIMEGGRVVGLTVRIQGGELTTYRARCGTILASGGFEWDDERLRHHFPGPVDFLASPCENDGAAHRIVLEAGGVLAHMDQANITGGIPVSSKLRPFGVSSFFHNEPNAIIVNRRGHRFTNETDVNLGVELDRRECTSSQPLHLPAWLISDSKFLKRQPLVRRAAMRNEGWLISADTLFTLAEKVGIPSTGLERAVHEFNQGAANGADRFGRKGRLRPIVSPPFIAVPFSRTIVSTKGGARTDECGRVLGKDGVVIKGLYCAGVAMANPIGSWALGPGTTLGPNMTWGFICANTLIDWRQRG